MKPPARGALPLLLALLAAPLLLALAERDGWEDYDYDLSGYWTARDPDARRYPVGEEALVESALEALAASGWRVESTRPIRATAPGEKRVVFVVREEAEVQIEPGEGSTLVRLNLRETLAPADGSGESWERAVGDYERNNRFFVLLEEALLRLIDAE